MEPVKHYIVRSRRIEMQVQGMSGIRLQVNVKLSIRESLLSRSRNNTGAICAAEREIELGRQKLRIHQYNHPSQFSDPHHTHQNRLREIWRLHRHKPARHELSHRKRPLGFLCVRQQIRIEVRPGEEVELIIVLVRPCHPARREIPESLRLIQVRKMICRAVHQPLQILG